MAGEQALYRITLVFPGREQLLVRNVTNVLASTTSSGNLRIVVRKKDGKAKEMSFENVAAYTITRQDGFEK